MYELTGQKTASGKRVIIPGLPDKKTKFTTLFRACGSCTGCRIKRRMDWSTRLEHESEYHENAWFVTMTYDPENLPHGGSLFHDHISIFIKALRQKTKQKIRYFGVGEYGAASPQNEYLARPHYHLIIFGPEFPDRELSYAVPQGPPPSAEFQMLFGPGSGIKHFKSDLLTSCWKRGLIEFTHVSTATMEYVTKFHIDKVTGDKAEEHYEAIAENGETIQRERETARMSSNPGIGRQWIEDNWETIYPHGYMQKRDVKYSPPAYYDKWLEKNKPELFEQLKKNRCEVISFEMHDDMRCHAVELNREAQLKFGANKIGSGKFRNAPGATAADLSAQFGAKK